MQSFLHLRSGNANALFTHDRHDRNSTSSILQDDRLTYSQGLQRTSTRKRRTALHRGLRCTVSALNDDHHDAQKLDQSEFDPQLLVSRRLSIDDHSAMKHVHGGCMPHLRLVQTNSNIPFLLKRIQELDMALQSRVQKISNRLRRERPPDKKVWLRVSLLGGLGKFFRWGVIQEIWAAILVYIIYTICVQWYVASVGWDLDWSATHQDSVYYPGLVLSFLLSLRASDCMNRYESGCEHCFEMERNLRDLAFEVLNNMSFERAADAEGRNSVLAHGMPIPPIAEELGQRIPAMWKKIYFRHEFRRLVQLLFFTAAHDLIDSDPNALKQEMECRVTDVEHAAICLTHSCYGHVFRVYIVATWIRKLLARIADEGFFEDPTRIKNCEELLRAFNASWFHARQVAYTRMPTPLRHILWILTNMMALALPWEYVSQLRWYTWPVSVCIVVSFFGLLRIADAMENPFGSDEDDIPIWNVAADLDEEICLIMYFSGLDKVGCENLYRSMFNEDQIYKMSVGFPL